MLRCFIFGAVIDQDEEVTDLETLLRQEREREKAHHHEDLDNEVGSKQNKCTIYCCLAPHGKTIMETL